MTENDSTEKAEQSIELDISQEEIESSAENDSTEKVEKSTELNDSIEEINISLAENYDSKIERYIQNFKNSKIINIPYENNNFTLIEKEDILEKIKNGILNDNELLSQIIKGENKIIEDIDFSYQIISTNNIDDYDNKISIIKLDDCEKELKKYYKIDENDPLLISKIDYKELITICN